jgi:hypothetical protein
MALFRVISINLPGVTEKKNTKYIRTIDIPFKSGTKHLLNTSQK